MVHRPTEAEYAGSHRSLSGAIDSQLVLADCPSEEAPMPLMLFAIAVFAAADTPPAAPAPRPIQICRKSEGEVGGHIHPQRRCKTAEEWAVEDARRDGKPASLRVTEGHGVDTGAPTSPH